MVLDKIANFLMPKTAGGPVKKVKYGRWMAKDGKPIYEQEITEKPKEVPVMVPEHAKGKDLLLTGFGETVKLKPINDPYANLSPRERALLAWKRKHGIA